jgi:hypothetical protein
LLVEAEGTRIRSKAFIPAVIDRDYFPRYLADSEILEFSNRQIARHSRLNTDLEISSYEVLAQKALQRHQWLTFGFLIRNLFRYTLSSLVGIVYNGIKARLQKHNR